MILSFFKEIENTDSNENEEEIWEDCDSDEEMTESNGKMEIEMEETNENHDDESNNHKKLKNLIKKQNLFEILIRTIRIDNENVYQDANRIEHIYGSIKLIKTEACETYSLLFKICNSNHESIEELNIEKDLLDLLDFLNKNFNKEDYTQEVGKIDLKANLRFVELIYDLYTSLANQNRLSMEAKNKIVILCKDIINKYKEFSVDIAARLIKIMSLVAIKERDTNINDGLQIIQVFIHDKRLSCLTQNASIY